MTDVSEVRRRSWATRRKKYGVKGHAGNYSRSVCASCERMAALIIRLHKDGILSEGQAATAIGMGRLDVRRRADNSQIDDGK